MNQRVLHLADVTVLFLIGLNKCRAAFVGVVDLVTLNKFGGKNVGSHEYWFGAQGANGSLREILLVTSSFLILVAAALIFD